MPSPFEISFHSSLSGPVAMRWPDDVRIASEAGFDAIDLDLRAICDLSAREVAAELQASGLRPGTAPLPVEFRQDEQAFLDDIADLPALADLAADVGVATMYRSIPASASKTRSQLEPVLRRRLSQCATILRERQIALALETLGPLHRRREGPYEMIWRQRECAALAQSCGDNVGVLVDAWHWHHAGEPTQSIIDLGDLILHAHIADAPALPPADIRDDERLLPGHGVVDLPAFMRALAEAGYEGLVSPEIPGRWCRSTSPVECARAALRAVRNTI